VTQTHVHTHTHIHSDIHTHTQLTSSDTQPMHRRTPLRALWRNRQWGVDTQVTCGVWLWALGKPNTRGNRRHTHKQTHTIIQNTHTYNVVIVTVRIYIDMTCTMYFLPVTSLSPLKKWRQSGDLSGSSACLTTLLLLLERLLSQQAIGCVTPRMTHFYLAPSRHLFWLERLLSQRE